MSSITRKELKSKDELYEELKLTLQLPIKGISFEPDTFKEVIDKHPALQLLHLCMDPSKDLQRDIIYRLLTIQKAVFRYMVD